VRRQADAQWRSSPEQQIQRAVFQHLAIRAASTVFAFHPANGGSGGLGTVARFVPGTLAMTDVISPPAYRVCYRRARPNP